MLQAGTASAAEAQQDAVLTGITEAELTLVSPRALQVFQRRTKFDGALVVSGRVKPACDKLEARVSGASLQGPLPGQWQRLPLDSQTRGFYAEVPTPAGGWYTLEVRALKNGAPVAFARIEKVGVGEVFVGAGQSNSTNSGQEQITQSSGMVSSFGGADWRRADDPQPGCHDQSTGGSFWPAFGDAMYAKYKVPIGVAATGHGGTSVTQWAPKGELFEWMLARMNQLGVRGFRAVLWHQGESDVGMPAPEYVARLTTAICGSTQAAGWEFPWFVAQASYCSVQNPSFPAMRAAQKQLWDMGVALEGPDTDTLTGDCRDNGGAGIHFSPKGLRAHGKMWAERVGSYLDQVVEK